VEERYVDYSEPPRIRAVVHILYSTSLIHSYNVVTSRGEVWTLQRATTEMRDMERVAMLVRGNAFVVLDLRLRIIDSVRGLDLQSNSLASETGKKTNVRTTPIENPERTR
jgi:hypothetical protein